MVDINKMKKAAKSGGPKRSSKSFDPADMIGYVEGPKGRDESGVLAFESIEHITDKAALLNLEGAVQMWVPKSQIMDADHESVEVTQWWANENGVELE